MLTGKQKRSVYYTIGGQATVTDMGKKVTPKSHSKRGYGRKLNSETELAKWLSSHYPKS